MNKTMNFSLYIGAAYLALGIISLLVDVPVKMVNGVSMGALLFSIAEAICAFYCNGRRRHSIVDILENEKNKDKYEVAADYLKEIQRGRIVSSGFEKSIVYKISVFLKILAFMSIIVYP